MEKIIKSSFIKIFLLYKLIFFYINIKPAASECPRDQPISISGECKLEYCTKNQFESKYCIINNSYAKTKWINNLIFIGELYFRYINFATYSEGHLVLETTCYPVNPKRMFFGIKQNGRPFFTNKTNNEETFYYSKTLDSENEKSLESKVFIIKESTDNGKEYFLSLSKLECNAELFDFDNDIVYKKTISDFTTLSSIFSLRHAFFSFSDSGSQHYYIFGFNSYHNWANKLYLQKHIFNSISNFEWATTYTGEGITEDNVTGYEASCFKTVNELIICFAFKKVDEQFYYYFLKYDSDFTNYDNRRIASTMNDVNTFYKCIHLKDEIGVFAYYYNFTTYFIPIFLFRIYNSEDNDFQYYLSSEYAGSGVMAKNYGFDYNVLLNDIVRLNENKIAFSSVIENKETIFVSLISVYSTNKVKSRYYLINFFSLYHYKVLFDLRISNFNGFIALGISLCPQQNCSYDENEHYSGLMIFSYPNSTDQKFDLDEYLIKNNNITFNDIEINLFNNLNFENNIFGYIISSINITEINNCGDYKLYSSKYETKEITGNILLEENENIKIKYTGSENFYPILNCRIKYYFIATEPELDIYNNFTDGDDDLSDEGDLFERLEYNGRLSYYDVILNNQLSSNCDDNCFLCHKNNISFCLTCKFNYSLININEGIEKICFDEIITIITTEIITEKEIIQTEPQEIIQTEPQEIIQTEPQEIIQTESQEIIQTEPQEIVQTESKEIIQTEPQEIIQTETQEIVQTESTTHALITEKEIDNICSNDDIIKNKCLEGSIETEQFNELFEKIKQTYLNSSYENNTIIQTQNVIFQISLLEDQKNSDNENISSIDLGDCEERLRSYYHLKDEDSLIVYKIDIKSSDLTQTYVQYQIYDSRNFSLLELSVCSDLKISVNTPVVLSSSTSSLYDSLKESGYDLFNESDSFYTDICSTYTTENGTDITLLDRKQIIFGNNANISLCQDGCELEYYNSTTKKANCECSPQINEIITNLEEIKENLDIKMVTDTLLNALKNSNFRVLKCYKLVFDFNRFIENYGSILMLVIALFFMISSIVFCIYDSKKINHYLRIVSEIQSNNKTKEVKTHVGQEKKKNKIEKENRSEITKINHSRRNSQSSLRMGKISAKFLKKKKFQPPKRKEIYKNHKSSIEINSTVKNLLSKKSPKHKNSSKNKIGGHQQNINIIKIKTLNIGKKSELNLRKKDEKKKTYTKSKLKADVKSKEKAEIKESKNKISIYNNRVSGKKLTKELISSKNLNDYELNTLEYRKAIIIDKRSYLKYYWSLLKTKHLLLFTFYPSKDYNLVTLKICLFLVSFSLYFTVNGFFFTDDTMHKIYEDNGAYNLFSQIPVILYSSVISTVINMILKQLALSEKNILALKQEKNTNKKMLYIKSIRNCLFIKFIIFFVLSFMLLLFFWYFISCFCAVYINTQLILIEDTLVSFALSMTYPIGLNLVPGMFRIPALRSPKKDKELIYKISGYIALIL